MYVLVYAGTDPLTGKDHYLTESTRDETEAQKILTRLLASVAEHRNPRTKATLERPSNRGCAPTRPRRRRSTGTAATCAGTILPALGELPIAQITPQVLEEFYADLRRCRHLCANGEPAVDHRTAMPHECRTVRHRRRPGRPGPEPHVGATSGCEVIECPPHECKPMAASSIRQVHWVLGAALAAAVRLGVDQVEPCGQRQEAQTAAAAAGAAHC